LYVVAHSFLDEPLRPEVNAKGKYREWYLSVPTILNIIYMRDGGTLADQAPGAQIWVPDSPSIVSRIWHSRTNPEYWSSGPLRQNNRFSIQPFQLIIR